MKNHVKNLWFPTCKSTSEKVPKAIYTIQYNTIRFGFESLLKTQNQTYVLVLLTNKQVFLSWFFFLSPKPKRDFSQTLKAVLHTFSTKLYTLKKTRCEHGNL